MSLETGKDGRERRQERIECFSFSKLQEKINRGLWDYPHGELVYINLVYGGV